MLCTPRKNNLSVMHVEQTHDFFVNSTTLKHAIIVLTNIMHHMHYLSAPGHHTHPRQGRQQYKKMDNEGLLTSKLFPRLESCQARATTTLDDERQCAVHRSEAQAAK